MSEIEQAIEWFEGSVIAEHEPGECPECDAARTAMAAMREQQERDKGCEWCVGELRWQWRVDDGNVSISYCPRCGKKLEGKA